MAEAGRCNVALQKVQQLESGREEHLKTSMCGFWEQTVWLASKIIYKQTIQLKQQVLLD